MKRLLLALLATAVSTASAQTLNIAVVPKGTTHEFWKAIHAGAIKAERELTAAGTPVRVIWKGPLKEDDREQQVQVVAAFAGPVDLVNPLIPHDREDQGVERGLEAENGSKRGRVDADDEGAEPDVAQHRREDRRNLRQALRKKFVTERIHGARYARAMAE